MKNTLIAETSISVDGTPAEVWKAITTPQLIKKYLMGTDVSSDWKEGSTITYNGEYEGKKYHDKGIIKKIEPEKIFQSTYLSSMSGKEDKPENYNLVTYKIEKKDNETVITLSQDNISNEKEKNHSTENWKMVLKKLKEVIESEKKY
ncbi:SRPBCC family protein [Flavobacterium sp. LT1R49]|uniref:SRPBCC family protein n=1 Tax=Flavobacterium arabinosi TaxID=3398737 RepID=UPI003A83A7E2